MTDPKPIYLVYLNESEKDNIIAEWEKSGKFPTIVEKIRTAENTKGIR